MESMTLEVEDFTGQVRRRARGIPRDATVGEFVNSCTHELRLPDIDVQGRPIIYGAIASNGDVLNATDRVGDVLVEKDVVTLTKAVTAG
jgi:hypothetical protein